MKALIYYKTTNKDLSVGLEVLVPSVNGTFDIGLDTPYKKAVIVSQTEYCWLIDNIEYMASEIVLIKLTMNQLTNQAFKIASEIHKDEKYGSHPYMYHINKVYDLAVKYYPNNIEIQCVAILHDTVETLIDNGWSRESALNRIWDEMFAGFDCMIHSVESDTIHSITRSVNLITDLEGASRSEKHLKTYPLIAEDYNATSAKLLDRLANTNQGVLEKNERSLRKLNRYGVEHAFFKDTLQVWDDCTHKLIFELIEKNYG